MVDMHVLIMFLIVGPFFSLLSSLANSTIYKVRMVPLYVILAPLDRARGGRSEVKVTFFRDDVAPNSPWHHGLVPRRRRAADRRIRLRRSRRASAGSITVLRPASPNNI